MEDNAYGKMKQLLQWNDANLRKKILAKEESHGPRHQFLNVNSIVGLCSEHTRSLVTDF
jgi:hypothetical protein